MIDSALILHCQVPKNIKQLKDDNYLKLINKKISDYIYKIPKSGFHLTLAYKRHGEKLNLESFEIENIFKKISLPLKININKIWLVKRDKNNNKDWYRSKTIFLKNIQ